jgi:hypothetical protein
MVKSRPTLGAITASVEAAQFHAGESSESVIQRADAKLTYPKPQEEIASRAIEKSKEA